MIYDCKSELINQISLHLPKYYKNETCKIFLCHSVEMFFGVIKSSLLQVTSVVHRNIFPFVSAGLSVSMCLL